MVGKGVGQKCKHHFEIVANDIQYSVETLDVTQELLNTYV